MKLFKCCSEKAHEQVIIKNINHLSQQHKHIEQQIQRERAINSSLNQDLKQQQIKQQQLYSLLCNKQNQQLIDQQPEQLLLASLEKVNEQLKNQNQYLDQKHAQSKQFQKDNIIDSDFFQTHQSYRYFHNQNQEQKTSIQEKYKNPQRQCFLDSLKQVENDQIELEMNGNTQKTQNTNQNVKLTAEQQVMYDQYRKYQQSVQDTKNLQQLIDLLQNQQQALIQVDYDVLEATTAKIKVQQLVKQQYKQIESMYNKVLLFNNLLQRKQQLNSLIAEENSNAQQ